MIKGHLSQFFSSVISKRLTSVEVDPFSSNQHELQGTTALRSLVGTKERSKIKTRFISLDDDRDKLIVTEPLECTWYNARENTTRSAEYKLYYPSNDVIELANASDSMFIAKCLDGSLLIVIAKAGSIIENQLEWLFGISLLDDSTVFKTSERLDEELNFAGEFILSQIGVSLEDSEIVEIDKLLTQFQGKMPSTKEFSEFARQTIPVKIDCIADPDAAILALMDWEYKLFRRMEFHKINKDLPSLIQGGNVDVEMFLQFSLSIQNTRKSRAGLAFEWHIAYILEQNNITFAHTKITENSTTPDFVFPSAASYQDAAFPVDLLNLLAAKTSCKERWKQVLVEGVRVSSKHLLTLEPSIPEKTTEEMKLHSLQLVVPKEIHSTYSLGQQKYLLTLKDFISLLSEKQEKLSEYTLTKLRSLGN